MTVIPPARPKAVPGPGRRWRFGAAVLIAAVVGGYVGYLVGQIEADGGAPPRPAALAMPIDPHPVALPEGVPPEAVALTETVTVHAALRPEIEPGTGRTAGADRPEIDAAPAPPVARAPIATWRANSAAFVDDGRPLVAIVIDDLGMSTRRTAEVAALPAPLTLAFFPYAPNLSAQVDWARLRGHELLVHMPMEPESPFADPGPEALEVDQEPAEMRRRLEWALDRFDGHIGLNNHMGSLFTTDRDGMDVVMSVLAGRGLAFLDSRTSAASVGVDAAVSADMPHAARDVFLDHERDPDAIRAALGRVEATARRHGQAIAIGHPYPETIAALADWVADLDARGLALAPLSAVIERREAGRRKAPAIAGDKLRHEPGG